MEGVFVLQSFQESFRPVQLLFRSRLSIGAGCDRWLALLIGSSDLLLRARIVDHGRLCPFDGSAIFSSAFSRIQAIEVSINRGDFCIFKWIRNYRAVATVVFMTLNALMLHGMRDCRAAKIYWLVRPLRPKPAYHETYESSPFMNRCSPAVRSELKICDHEHSCDSYIVKVSAIDSVHARIFNAMNSFLVCSVLSVTPFRASANISSWVWALRWPGTFSTISMRWSRALHRFR